MDNIGNELKSDSFKQTCNCVLGIAAVPIQQFGSVYDNCKALKRGTIFPDLDLPFFAGGDNIE
ncbi:MAG TPA: spore coat associated protein CotJA [Candidatus Pelethocola excrementipullorum]|nr:spore coat associated protein CotJA [Candidatus Pelethocola excrementipullorum]